MLPSPPAEMDYYPVSKRKRKQSDVDAEEARDRSFQLQNLTTSSYLSFEPVLKLLRAHLPLSWLASTTSHDELPLGTLLQGCIKHVNAWEYSVLITRHLPNGGLFVFEKVDQDCFVSHPLQPFVTEQWVQDASIGASPPVNLQMMLHYIPVVEPLRQKTSRRTPSLTSDPMLKIPKNRKGAAARLSILSQMEKQEDLTPSPTLHQVPVHTEDIEEDWMVVEPVQPTHQDGDPVQEASNPLHAESLTAEPLPLEVVQQPDMLSPTYLRQRYLETLYTTKTSLAFYAKGPLSRARARARVSDASMTPSDLAMFYRESVLPTKKLELKYKESIRESIRKTLQDSNADQNPKKKSSKRTKLGKDGLWPVEAEYIAQWWKARTLMTSSSSQQELEIQNAIAVLRMRETQMQIIIILEALAIESKHVAAKSPENETSTQSIDAATIDHDPLPTNKLKTIMKKRNLEIDLELLAGKLCIQHCLGLDDASLSNTAPKKADADDDQVDSKDQLRDFCTDILIPFYSSKLPLLCKSLCNTLAGPEVFDQAQKAARVHQNSAQPLAPGAVIKRRPQSRSNTIERVLSEDLRQPSPPPLSRSATLPPVPQFKRELSEVPQRPLSRQTSITFSGREVDLVADAKATASKKRKLDLVAAQKQMVTAAIQVLRKPNRQVAGGKYMDEVERRKAGVIKPVLITATPRANRRKPLLNHDDNDDVLRAAFDDTIVPSSGVKPKDAGYSQSIRMSSNKKKAVLGAIYDTPSRSTSKKSDPLQLSNKLVRMSFSEVGSARGCQEDLASAAKQGCASPVLCTPVKERPTASKVGNDFHLSDLALQTMDRAMKMPVSEFNL